MRVQSLFAALCLLATVIRANTTKALYTLVPKGKDTLPEFNADLVKKNLPELFSSELSNVCLGGALQEFMTKCLSNGLESISFEIERKTTVAVCLCEFQQVYTPNDNVSGISDVLQHCLPKRLDDPLVMTQCMHTFKTYPQTWMTYTTVLNKLPQMCQDYAKPFERLQMIQFMDLLKNDVNELLDIKHAKLREELTKEIEIQKNILLHKFDALKTDTIKQNEKFWKAFVQKSETFYSKIHLSQKMLKAGMEAQNGVISKDVESIKHHFLEKMSLFEAHFEDITTIIEKHSSYLNILSECIHIFKITAQYLYQYRYFVPVGLLLVWFTGLKGVLYILLSLFSKHQLHLSTEMTFCLNIGFYCSPYLFLLFKRFKLTRFINCMTILYGALLVQEDSKIYVLIYYFLLILIFRNVGITESKKIAILTSLAMITIITLTLSLSFYKVLP